MEIMIKGTKETNKWEVEAGDIVTERHNNNNDYFIVVELDIDEFMLVNLNSSNYKQFETTSTSSQNSRDIESEYFLVKKHNDVKVVFSW